MPYVDFDYIIRRLEDEYEHKMLEFHIEQLHVLHDTLKWQFGLPDDYFNKAKKRNRAQNTSSKIEESFIR